MCRYHGHGTALSVFRVWTPSWHQVYCCLLLHYGWSCPGRIYKCWQPHSTCELLDSSKWKLMQMSMLLDAISSSMFWWKHLDHKWIAIADKMESEDFVLTSARKWPVHIFTIFLIRWQWMLSWCTGFLQVKILPCENSSSRLQRSL